MKTNFFFKPFGAHFKGTLCAGAILLLTACAWSQNLFVGIAGTPPPNPGDIYEFSPSGVQSTFASGPNAPEFPIGLAFNSADDLFVGDPLSGNIYEFTPGGVQSTFASGLDSGPLAFNKAGDLFSGDPGSGNIYEFTPGGVRSTFASGLAASGGLAFNSAGDLFAGDPGSGNIYEFTPGGVRSTFATVSSSGVATAIPVSLAFDSAGNLFVTDPNYGVYEFTPGGVQSDFAPAFSAFGLAIQPVPEPSFFGVLAVGAAALFTGRLNRGTRSAGLNRTDS